MKKEYPFGQFSWEHLQKMRKGLELFNNEEYWDCHEEFEDLWMEDSSDPARYIYWAILQVGVSIYHFQNHNQAGAQGLIRKAKEKFRIIRERKIWSPLLEKYFDWDNLERLALSIPDEAQLEEFSILQPFKFDITAIPWEEKS